MAQTTIGVNGDEVIVFTERDYLCDEDVIAILDEAAAKVRGTVPHISETITTEVPKAFIDAE